MKPPSEAVRATLRRRARGATELPSGHASDLVGVGGRKHDARTAPVDGEVEPQHLVERDNGLSNHLPALNGRSLFRLGAAVSTEIVGVKHEPHERASGLKAHQALGG